MAVGGGYFPPHPLFGNIVWKLWACQGKTASQDGSREVAPQISCLSSGSRVLRKAARDLSNYPTIFPWDYSLGARGLLEMEGFRRNSSPAT